MISALLFYVLTSCGPDCDSLGINPPWLPGKLLASDFYTVDGYIVTRLLVRGFDHIACEYAGGFQDIKVLDQGKVDGGYTYTLPGLPNCRPTP